jgi:hypothetical protein
MPTVDEFWQVAGQVASECGGLVVGFSEDALQPELGSTLDTVLGFQSRSSPTIVSLANWTDWKEQVEAFYRLRPSWGRGKVGDSNAKYYRVTFQAQDGSGCDSLSNTTADPPFSSHLSVLSFGGYAEPAGSLQGATFWPRTLARFIDLVVHYAVSFVAGFLFVFLLAVAAGGRPPLLVLQRISQIGFSTFVAGLLVQMNS